MAIQRVDPQAQVAELRQAGQFRGDCPDEMIARQIQDLERRQGAQRRRDQAGKRIQGQVQDLRCSPDDSGMPRLLWLKTAAPLPAPAG
jgi:hypothetical protein